VGRWMKIQLATVGPERKPTSLSTANQAIAETGPMGHTRCWPDSWGLDSRIKSASGEWKRVTKRQAIARRLCTGA
jgi:hypothetical protein